MTMGTMGIPTLIGSAHTASGAASISITSGISSSYDEYMFVLTNINPVTDNVTFGFQVNQDGATGYNETISSSWYEAYQNESDDSTAIGYNATYALDSETTFQALGYALGNGADEHLSGRLHLYRPSNTTYKIHFHSWCQLYQKDNYSRAAFAGGVVELAAAIDEIQFKPSSGNFDGVIQMFGIA